MDVAKLNYRVEYAQQGDASMNIHGGPKAKADADYYNLDLGASITGILAGVNYEFLSGTNGTDGKTQFSTPLATLHKFNGWADKFLATPTGGLKDLNVRVGYKAKGFGKLLAIYHDYTADKTMAAGTGRSDDLGSEIDAVYVNKIPGVKNLKGLLKYASYSKGTVNGYTNDVQKIWAQLDYRFSF